MLPSWELSRRERRGGRENGEFCCSRPAGRAPGSSCLIPLPAHTLNSAAACIAVFSMCTCGPSDSSTATQPGRGRDRIPQGAVCPQEPREFPQGTVTLELTPEGSGRFCKIPLQSPAVCVGGNPVSAAGGLSPGSSPPSPAPVGWLRVGQWPRSGPWCWGFQDQGCRWWGCPEFPSVGRQAGLVLVPYRAALGTWHLAMSRGRGVCMCEREFTCMAAHMCAAAGRFLLCVCICLCLCVRA